MAVKGKLSPSDPVRGLGHDLRCPAHEQSRGLGQVGGTRVDCVVAMLLFLIAHLLDDGATSCIVFGQSVQVAGQVGANLAFGLGYKTEAPFVAKQTADGTDCEGARVPQRAQAAGPGTEFCQALLAP